MTIWLPSIADQSNLSIVTRVSHQKNMTDLGKIWRDGRLEVDLEIEYDWRRRLSRFQWLALPVVEAISDL